MMLSYISIELSFNEILGQVAGVLSSGLVEVLLLLPLAVEFLLLLGLGAYADDAV
jgi:hypothetical protein